MGAGAAALLLAALVACAAASGSTEDACGLDCRAFLAPNFRVCLRGIHPGSGRAVFLEDGAPYEHARRVWNSRHSAFPAAVFYAHDTADVSAAVRCAHRWGVRVSPASGRQGLQGASVMDGFLTVDVSNLTQIAISPDNKTMSMGAGATAVMITSAVYDSGIPGAAVPTTGCPYVGAAGYYLTGGLGIPGRYLGLHCDSVTALEVVLFNGTIIRADAEHNADLLWASCGGGGGTFGVVTQLELRISTLPEGGRVTAVEIKYARGVGPTVASFMAFQHWLESADRRFDFTHSIGGGRLSLHGVFLGRVEEALSLLKAGGVLEHLDPHAAMDPTYSDVAAEFPYGLRLKAYPHFYCVHAETTIFWTDVYGYPTPWPRFSPLHKLSAEQRAFLDALMRGQGEHRIVGGPAYSTWFNTQSRLVTRLREEGVRALAEYFVGASEACRANSSAAACYAGMGGHVMGGAYEEEPPQGSAYPYRSRVWLLNGMASPPTPVAEAAPAELLEEVVELNHQFLRVLKPHLDEPEAGYVGYQLPAFEGWQRGYFGHNYERLQQIKAKYDPAGLFDKPFTVQGSAAVVGAGQGGGWVAGGARAGQQQGGAAGTAQLKTEL